MFHVWFYNERRRTLMLLTKKTLSRWDQGEVPAVWNNRPTAQEWADKHIGRGNYKVFACEGERCGMKAHE